MVAIVKSYIARCVVCSHQWAIVSEATPPGDSLGCNFCGAGPTAVRIEQEETFREGETNG